MAFPAAFDAVRAAGQMSSVYIRIVWEGEVEAGSPHLAASLTAHRDLLKADLWLLGDGPVHQLRQPAINFGARGVMGLDITLYGPVRALHDGHFGNRVPNPAVMAANLVAALRDDVRPLTPAESAAIAALPQCH